MQEIFSEIPVSVYYEREFQLQDLSSNVTSCMWINTSHYFRKVKREKKFGGLMAKTPSNTVDKVVGLSIFQLSTFWFRTIPTEGLSFNITLSKQML